MEGVAVWLSTLCRRRQRARQTASFSRLEASSGQPTLWPASLLLASSPGLQNLSVNGNLIELVNSKEITFCLQSRLNPEVFLKDFKIATENKITLYSNYTVMSSATENILNSSI